MIRVQQIKLPISYKEKAIEDKILKILRIKPSELKSFSIYRRSLDARKKPNLIYSVSVNVEVTDEEKVYSKHKNNKQVAQVNDYKYNAQITGEETLKDQPVIVGSGPAGLFCGLILAENGFKPIILERGKDVDARDQDIQKFWQEGILNTESNVQFGEGGAGTFSDGKLNTLVKDKNKRGRKVLEAFVEAGAPSEILYVNKPHIGTDILRHVVKNIRKKIIELGGEVRFENKVTNILVEGESIVGVEINHNETLKSECVILAIGHSARDTFEMLYDQKIQMTQKAFAVGVRIEHPQKMIDQNQYGDINHREYLGAADYKLTHQCSNGRSVYTFCMCPGGVVVGAASEEGRLVTNGMSYHKRDKENANSALLVGVGPSDFGSDHPLAGMAFQRGLEEAAFKAGGQDFSAPIQLVGDFLNGRPSKGIGQIKPSFTGKFKCSDLSEVFPVELVESLKEGIQNMDRRIKGFAHDEAILTGVESRSSSPIRIERDKLFESSIKGLYPAGEGAGYAGGIMSAAMDGIKVSEKIFEKYKGIEER